MTSLRRSIYLATQEDKLQAIGKEVFGKECTLPQYEPSNAWANFGDLNVLETDFNLPTLPAVDLVGQSMGKETEGRRAEERWIWLNRDL